MRYLSILFFVSLIFASCHKKDQSPYDYSANNSEYGQHCVTFTGTVMKGNSPVSGCIIYGQPCQCILDHTASDGTFNVSPCVSNKNASSTNISVYGYSPDGKYSFVASSGNGVYQLVPMPVYAFELRDTSLVNDTINIFFGHPMASYYLPSLYSQKNLTRTSGDTSFYFVSGSSTCYATKKIFSSSGLRDTSFIYNCNNNDTLHIIYNY